MERRGRESRMKQKQTSRRGAVATGWEREAGEDGGWSMEAMYGNGPGRRVRSRAKRGDGGGTPWFPREAV